MTILYIILLAAAVGIVVYLLTKRKCGPLVPPSPPSPPPSPPAPPQPPQNQPM